ncbi:MAG: ABC transporter ATP-binding protein, partial [Chloroflexota bacterium]
MAAAPALLVADHLRRIYTSGRLGRKREQMAVDDVSFQIEPGEVFGLLGPNGAGKTTSLRMLSTLLLPTSGKATIFGFDVVSQADEVRKRIGLILGGDQGLYWRLTGLDNLRYFGALNRMSPREARERGENLLALVGLSDRANSMVQEYSRGMRQRLHIARGLMTDPNLLFMDEPTIGLD